VWLQTHLHPSFDIPALFLHHFIREEVVLFVGPWFVWCLNYKLGSVGLILVSLGELINGVIKWMLRLPRPAWISSRLVNIRGSFEEDYSTPSSHSMLVANAFVYFVWENPLWWVILICVVIIVVVGLSRVFLGVHYPHDIVFGWVISVGFSVSFIYVQKWLDTIPDWWSMAWTMGWLLLVLGLLLCVRIIFPPTPAELKKKNGRSR